MTGISFRETMSGGFAMGTTDPHAGEEQGEKAGTQLAMHGTITVDDLDRFIKIQDHPGTLAGSIDFAPLGTGLPSTSGIFNLFSPTNDPKTKYMVYEMAFQAQGQPYYFAGHKDVRNDRGVDFWHDVTTLYTQLHKGPDKSGPVIAAGTLTLTIRQLLKMAPTFRVSGAKSKKEEAAAMARFGSFFLGELWDTYIMHRPGGH